jgi:hypothetical protein
MGCRAHGQNFVSNAAFWSLSEAFSEGALTDGSYIGNQSKLVRSFPACAWRSKIEKNRKDAAAFADPVQFRYQPVVLQGLSHADMGF